MGAAGYVYEVVVLNIGRLYRLLEKIFHVPLITLPYLPLSRFFQSAISFHKFLVAGNQLVFDLAQYRIQFYRSFSILRSGLSGVC